MCMIHIRRFSPGPYYQTGPSPHPKPIYLPQNHAQRWHSLRRLWYRVFGVTRWVPSWTYDHQPSDADLPPYNDVNMEDDADLEDGPPTPPNVDDCPELVFDREDRSNYEGEIRHFNGSL
ncbi:hypothetical protein AOQ84DRAFT_378113 [Glonium stellatum]|uniref:Uncharacterized protein n=1 Tax=Glonium stellatum TaxID=574774 RepID=A0A8E2EYG8_9PEZI|nr:hypothetical protein AOQ84DRAFT_378113 [Glonium stellatum]